MITSVDDDLFKKLQVLVVYLRSTQIHSLYLHKGCSMCCKYSLCKCLRMYTWMYIRMFRYTSGIWVFLFCKKMSQQRKVKLCKMLPCSCADACCVGLWLKQRKPAATKHGVVCDSFICCCFRAPTASARYTVELLGQFSVAVKEISEDIEHLHSTLKSDVSNSETAFLIR